MRKIKNKIFLLLIFSLYNCGSKQITTLHIESPNEIFIENEKRFLKDTTFGGIVNFTHKYMNNNETFISTESMNVIIYGSHTINKGDSIFIVFPDKNRDYSKATIIWEKDQSEHEIYRRKIN